MIGNHIQVCRGGHEASAVCIEQSCASFALCCDKECDCQKQHQKHRMVPLSSMISMARASAAQLQVAHQSEQEVTNLIDTLIANLRQLKITYTIHVQNQIELSHLLSMLVNHVPLISQEQPTGSRFYQLRQAFGWAGEVGSTCQLSQQLKTIQSQLAELSQKVMQLYTLPPINVQQQSVHLPLPFSFSRTLSTGLQLKENDRRALTSYAYRGLAMVEPALSMTAPSSISFRINRKSPHGFVYVGVGYPSRMQHLIHAPIWMTAGHGAYLQRNDGYLFSDPVGSNEQLSDVRFTEGEIVTMWLQPTTGLLTYSANGTTYQQRTDIHSGTTDIVHFFVDMNSPDAKCDVSII